MTWQAASFAGLALVLVSGFWWYERTRPSARVVALVAALAALAVAGRLVFAPVPNVVATTDIALITGYALGGPPGFAVGALAAPISNIWLGQGPWTVWQMGGWGLAGLAGAGLAVMTARRLGRLGLALACAVMALVYGALLDLSVMVTYGGEQSLDRYAALSARAVPFNVAHALGNFAIAFAAGPALVAMISRYRSRLDFRWHPAGAITVLALALMLAPGTASEPRAEAAGVSSARAWLAEARESQGGYSATPGGRPSPQMTGWAMLGLEAAGRNPLDVGPRGATPADYLKAHAGRIRSVNELELAILALEGAGVSSRRVGGNDLVAALTRRQSSDGSWSGQVNLTAYAVLALRAAGSSAGVSRAQSWLRAARNGDGGWGFGPGRPSEPDSTGAAMQGLAGAGSTGALNGAIAYLRRTQRREGGWGLNETGVTNSQSTAWAVQGLVAAGVSPGRVKRRGHSGLDYLKARQRPDGSYAYSSSSAQTPVWVTSQALLAASREALPIEPVARGTGGSPTPDVSSDADPPASTAPGTVREDGDGSRPGRRRRDDGGSKRKGEKGSGEEGEEKEAAAPAADVLAEQAAGSQDAGDGDARTLALLIGAGLGGLALVLAGGWFWYRRRLPRGYL